MLRRLMDILVCPVCKKALKLRGYRQRRVHREGDRFPGCHRYCAFISQELILPDKKRMAHLHCPECYQEDVIDGILTCPDGDSFPIKGSIPVFTSSTDQRKRTKKGFDVEWLVFHYGEKIYGHSQDEELQDFFHRMVVDEKFLGDKTILDAGCGIGRLAQSVSSLAREVIAIDFSDAVGQASKLNEKRPTLHFVQGNIMKMPFKGGVFDYVYSKGVLHYVPDVRSCLAQLTTLVKSGGTLSVTLYPKMSRQFEAFNRGLRRITVRLPIMVVYWLSHLFIPFLSWSWRWSGLEKRRIDWNERAHMIFNWFASEYQNRASNEEMVWLFRELGFGRIKISFLPVGITGTKKDYFKWGP